MEALTTILTHHHQHCDELFTTVEAKVHEGDWQAAQEAQQRLNAEIEWHFQAEENRLFPSFEALTGMSGGPTAVMREEHAQMRELLEECGEAIGRQDGAGFADRAETLLILLQQHNLKEENVLYPMCEHQLGAEGEQFAAQFAQEIAAL